MAASRRIVPYASHLKEGRWQSVSITAEKNLLGRTLKGKTLGIWGYGKIGKIIASYGKAFGMQILIWGREASRNQARKDGYQVTEDKQSFFANADIVSLHLRLNEDTNGIVKHEDLAKMKTDALFVNTSRAELVEKGALTSALINGRPGQAAIDVFEEEPVQVDLPLLRMENVLATPHLGYVEENSYELYLGAAFQNILDFEKGETKSVLNPDAIKKLQS
jgi:D-3-phosphoglycerate dehydrogenase